MNCQSGPAEWSIWDDSLWILVAMPKRRTYENRGTIFCTINASQLAIMLQPLDGGGSGDSGDNAHFLF